MNVIDFILWALAILGIGFLASAMIAAVVDRIRMKHHPADAPDPLAEKDAEALTVGRYVYKHAKPGEEVWIRVRRCEEPCGRHMDVGLLPAIKGPQ